MNHLHDEWGDDGGLSPALDAFAEGRLRADPERTGVVRARVMAAARAQARRAGGAPAARRRWFVLPRAARGPLLAGAGLLLAAMLAGGALAGTAPGGPLYGARVWLEEQLLPVAPQARDDAQLDRLDDRLAEAEMAAAQGDVAAVEAALDEYRRTAEAAFDAAGDDAARREHVAAAIARHVAVLEALTATVPERAAVAIRAAVERTEVRIREILDDPGRPGPPASPEATPKPTPKPKPEATPKPTPKPKPEATPKPTPKPSKSPPGKPEATPEREKPTATPEP